MWIKELAEVMRCLYTKYGVSVVIESMTGDGIVFRMRKGHFKKVVGYGCEDLLMMTEDMLNDVLIHLASNAREIADAYDCTNKSKAWNETLQEIGVREG